MVSPSETLREPARLPVIALRGISIHAVSERECVDHVFDELGAGRGGWIVTPNLDHLRRLTRDANFRSLCERAELRVADGMPLLWAARLQGTPLPERVAGSNLIWSLSERAARAGRSVYLLGGDPGTAEESARVLRERFTSLRIAGIHCPAPGFERDAQALAQISAELARSGADLVLVALGSPKQEQLIAQLCAQLPRAWWIGIGISFSFVAGRVTRAPRWMQRLGLEWVHRLAQEPRRLARRYLVDGLPFAAALLVGCAWRGMRRTPNGAPRG